MKAFLLELVVFLRRHPWWWILPLALSAALLVWLAHATAGRPAVPFTYRF